MFTADTKQLYEGKVLVDRAMPISFLLKQPTRMNWAAAAARGKNLRCGDMPIPTLLLFHPDFCC